jgi:hypothetical protein
VCGNFFPAHLFFCTSSKGKSMARKDPELPRRKRHAQDDEEREHAQLRKELQEDLRRTREYDERLLHHHRETLQLRPPSP